ncbi:MAG TPA: hypothetical protein ENJ31_09405 [Anaerolineae bacterium]|nr:hypothetical protein [Anaerolineae bacterium]
MRTNPLERTAEVVSLTRETKIPWGDIRTDGGTQARVSINMETVQEYAEAMERGDKFPPLLVYHDGQHYWLVDGFHRHKAIEMAFGIWEDVAVEIRQGSRREAVLAAVGANARHGLRRTNADKRNAVLVLLRDDEWRQWSNREIARRAAVSEKMVRMLRQELEREGEIQEATTRIGADGRVQAVGNRKPREVVNPAHVREWANEHEEISGRTLHDLLETLAEAGPLRRQLKGWLQARRIVTTNLETVLHQMRTEARNAARGRSTFVAATEEEEEERSRKAREEEIGKATVTLTMSMEQAKILHDELTTRLIVINPNQRRYHALQNLVQQIEAQAHE